MARDPNSLILSYKFKGTRPFKHQVRALQKALTLDKSIALHMEPGTGKTRIAIDFIGIKHDVSGIRKVLVIAPNIALEVWQDQIFEYLPRVINRQIILLNKGLGTVNDRMRELAKYKKVDKLTFMLVNYDVIADMKEALRQWKPEMIILDESHFVKKHSSQRSKAAHYLASTPRWKMALSGTPITNSPMDLFSQYKFLDSEVLGTRWQSFKYRYAVYGGYGGFELKSYQNLDELSKLTSGIAFEATKDEMDLPSKLPPQVIKIPMTPKTKGIYDSMEEEMIAYIESLGKKITAAIVLTKMIRLSQTTGGFARVIEGEDDNRLATRKDVQIGSEKLDALKELLELHCVEGGYKVVIFARFKWETRAIHELCGKMGLMSILDAGIREDRKVFQQNPKCKVFIVPLAQGGIAVNELVAAHIGIFYSMDYSSDHIIQAMDRLHRPGQSQNVLYQFLALKGTIDEALYMSFVEKKSLADLIVYKIRRKEHVVIKDLK